MVFFQPLEFICAQDCEEWWRIINEVKDLLGFITNLEGKSKFSEHVLKEGLKMKTIEGIMSIIHHENHHRKTNTLEEIEILKAASSKHLLNNVNNARREKKLQDPLKISR